MVVFVLDLLLLLLDNRHFAYKIIGYQYINQMEIEIYNLFLLDLFL